MFLQMLKDEHPEVRLHIISKLDIVNKGTYILSLGAYSF
jgi:serine/threonine-protein phosphatase 2A regulatory subunit A